MTFIKAILRFKNGVFAEALQNIGYKSVAEYCKETGLRYSTIIAYSGLKSIPRDPVIRKKMVETLYEDEYTLFDQFEDAVLINKKKPLLIANIPKEKFVELTHPDVLMLESENTVDQSMINDSLSIDLNQGLKKLKDRERLVLEQLYGLNGKKAMNLEETAKEFGLSRERMRQIREKALRRMRHRARSEPLLDYIRHPTKSSQDKCPNCKAEWTLVDVPQYEYDYEENTYYKGYKGYCSDCHRYWYPDGVYNFPIKLN